MDAATAALQTSSSPTSPSKQLRDKLRTTVCCCFGSGGSSGGSAERTTRWRRRGGAAGEFRYDALSYALNFDEGEDDDAAYADPNAAFRYRNFSARLPPSPASSAAAAAAVGTQRQRAIAIA